MLHSISYIYYKVLKIQICFSEADPTLECNLSMFIIFAALSYKSLCYYSNSRMACSDNIQEGKTTNVNTAQSIRLSPVQTDRYSKGKHLIRHEA